MQVADKRIPSCVVSNLVKVQTLPPVEHYNILLTWSIPTSKKLFLVCNAGFLIQMCIPQTQAGIALIVSL